MTFQRLIIGIGIWIPAMLFACSSWSQSQPGDTSFSRVAIIHGSPNDAELALALRRLPPDARRAFNDLTSELDMNPTPELLALRFEKNLCQLIACQGVPPDTVRQFVAMTVDRRYHEDARQTAERGNYIAAAALVVSFLSLLISARTYWRTVRSTKGAIPA